MKTFEEIDLNETPIVVLGCGHFFTAETLDGHIGLSTVYEQDKNGVHVGLRDISSSFQGAVPRCPDCQQPFRQHSTQRFNRVVNRAVLDEMSKRFLVHNTDRLKELGAEVAAFESELQESQGEILATIREIADSSLSNPLLKTLKMQTTSNMFKERIATGRKLHNKVKRFREGVADKNQPVQKLYEAMVNVSKDKSIDNLMRELNINGPFPTISLDRRISFGGRATELRMECMILADKFSVAQSWRSTTASMPTEITKDNPESGAKSFFKTCNTFIDDCDAESLPKLGVEAILLFATLARSFRSYCQSTKTKVEQASNYVQAAKDLLEKAKALCTKQFQNSDQLGSAAEESIKLLGKEWYEEVTPEEITAIKSAMVSGPRGIATHSGHWYNCANGHPFAIGECGMPMQEARCPECGAPVGGQSHQPAAGVTRAENMER
ncbi:hypothetical protein ACLMJK_003690 [Lecanora helva]